MARTTLRLSLESPDGTRVLLSAMSWPEALEAEALQFIHDNLLVQRAGSPKRASELLREGRVPPQERARFLADKPTFLPEPPQALAEALDLEDFVAEFGVALRALRAAPADQTFVLEWK